MLSLTLRSALGACLAIALVAGSGAPAEAYYRPPGATQRVSLPDGWTGPHDADPEVSVGPDVSADGRYVAFVSSDPSLVPGDTNGHPDVFVRDIRTTVTERVSVASDGTQANNWSGLFFILWDAPSISADGRYVAFMSEASNLVPGDTNEVSDAFVHDRHTGTTEIVSVSSDGAIGDWTTQAVDLSADGRYVAMESAATNLVPNDTTTWSDIYVHDRQTGETELVSVSSDEVQADDAAVHPSISGDGRYVAFTTEADNVVPDDTNGTIHRQAGRDVFVRDRLEGTTTRVSVTSDGEQGNSYSQRPVLSADGSTVAFISLSANLVPNDANGTMDLFVRDLASGMVERVSVAIDGGETGGASNTEPSLSADGRFVAYASAADTVVPDDGNSTFGGSAGEDVFVVDRATGDVERVTVADDGTEGDSNSSDPAMSADGRHVAFVSEAANLVPGDDTGCLNSCFDVFVRERGPALGVGSVSTAAAAGSATVSGWMRLPSEVLASAREDAPDGSENAASLGGELTSASVSYRPETQDVMLRIGAARLPGLRPANNVWPSMPGDPGMLWCSTCSLASASGAPGVRYGVSLAIDGVQHEIRVERGNPGNGDIRGVDRLVATFGLFRCAGECEHVATLSGGYGTRADSIEISLPFGTANVGPGTTFSGIQAFAHVVAGSVLVERLDGVVVGDVVLPASTIQAGLVARGEAVDRVSSWSALNPPEGGRFSGTIDGPTGPHRVWVRACHDARCTATPADVEII